MDHCPRAYHCQRTRLYFYHLSPMPEAAKELLFCKLTMKIVWPACVLMGAIASSFHLLTLGARCSHTPKGGGLSCSNISPCLVAVPTIQKLYIYLLAVLLLLLFIIIVIIIIYERTGLWLSARSVFLGGWHDNPVYSGKFHNHPLTQELMSDEPVPPCHLYYETGGLLIVFMQKHLSCHVLPCGLVVNTRTCRVPNRCTGGGSTSAS